MDGILLAAMMFGTIGLGCIAGAIVTRRTKSCHYRSSLPRAAIMFIQVGLWVNGIGCIGDALFMLLFMREC
jgi:hypothetical protein